MKNALRGFGVGALAATTLFGVSCTSGDETTERQAVVSAPLPADLNLMLNAKTTLAIGPYDTLAGDIGASGPKGSVLIDVAATQHGITAANTVVVRTDATAGYVYGNDITVDGTAWSQILGLDPAELPQVPTGSPTTAGGTNFSVATNQTRQLCPGQYGAITVGAGATLNLNGGIYQISKLSLADGAKLLPSEPVVLLITGGVTTTAGAVIDAHPQSLSPLTAADIRIEAGGAITLGDNNQIHAHLLAAGKLTTGTQLNLLGAAWAKSIAIGAHSTLTGEAVFAQLAVTPPPPCNDHNACTTDTCVGGGTAVAYCRNTPVTVGTSCEDGNLCNGAETCDAHGSCSPGTPPAAGTSCADGDACNGAETCDGTSSCAAGAPPEVDDNNACTADACDATAGVTHTPLPDGTACNGNGVCQAGACSSQGATYSQYFDSYYSDSQCYAWNDFLQNQLTSSSYSKITMSGSYDPTGITCSDPSAATQICNALHTGGYATVTCGAHTWYVGSCGGTELNIDAGTCSCSYPGYDVRPCLGYGEWGGVNTDTCYGITQTMNVTCE